MIHASPHSSPKLIHHSETRPYIEAAESGGSLIDQLTLPPHNLARTTIIDRFQGSLFSTEGTLTCLFLTMTQYADSHRQLALRSIKTSVADAFQLTPQDVHLVGPFVYRTSLDYESTRNLGWIAIAACLIGLALTWTFLRRFRTAVITLCCGAFGGSCTIVLVGVSGGRMSPVMLVMPTLVFVLATSAAIHLINYFRDAVADSEGKNITSVAVHRAWKPCWYAALTTAIGLVSLGISDVRPIQAFGFYSAAGVIGSLFLVFLVLPGVLEFWPPRIRLSSQPNTADSEQPSDHRYAGFHWINLSRFVSRHWMSMLWVGVLASCFLAVGLLKVVTSARIGDLFSPNTRIIRDYTWLEDRFGPLDPIEVTVDFSDTDAWSMIEQLEVVSNLAGAIDAMPDSGGTISAASFLPAIPTGRSIGQTAKRAVFNRFLKREQELLVQSQYYRPNGQRATWRIRTQVAALGDLAYGQFIRQIAATSSPIMKAHQGDGKTLPSLDFTGLPLFTQAVQQRLLVDLFRSYLAAFVVISLVICLMQRSVAMGLAAMLPNLFPAVAVFGMMGWLGQPVDIGAMVTASVALGIAVDDTLHFMIWYRHGRLDGQSPSDAVSTAYRRCATAMVHTTLICGLALLPHAISSCVPVARFAWLMLSLLVAALVGDLLLLPAILTGVAGRNRFSPSSSAPDE